jgi:3'-phosphoadenosine 5'-phosphosulfate sulfotransferase (PAPS reductase)/FAD synthetase
MRTIHLCSISGGIDSLATALEAKERAEKREMDLRFINADLGKNEAKITHDYIGYLERALGAPIQRVRADFSAEFAERRENIQLHWSKEKRRKEHDKECKARREYMKFAEWRKLCACKIRVSPPVPQDIIDRAKALLVPTGEPFLDLCMLKGRFPSRTAQFCTERLKLEPINAITHPVLEAGGRIVSWIGEMAEESPKRARKPIIQRIRWSGSGQLILYRPLLHRTKADNFALAKRHGIKINPLYLMGFKRVGCFPCINCGKEEIAQIDQRAPSEIDRIEEWEIIVAMVSRRGDSTFFPAPMVPGDEDDYLRASIRKAVEWAKTTRGGRQFDLLQRLKRDQADEEGAMCESAYGLCE